MPERFADFSLPPLEERTVVSVVQEQARRRPDAVALVDATTSCTYGELLERAAVRAGGLAEAGIRPGDRVLLLLDPDVDAYVTWLALACLGAVEVPVNPALRGDFLRHAVADAEPVACVADAVHADLLRSTGIDVAMLFARGGDGTGRAAIEDIAGDPIVRSAAPWDTGAIFYTSGTTGRSKGVVMPQAQLYGYATPAALGAASPGDVSYVVMPFFHVGGQLWGVYNALIAGSTAAVGSHFSASRFWDDTGRVGATFATLAGAMVSFLLAQPPTDRDRDVSIQKVCLAPVPPNVEEFTTRFGVTYCTGYGSTEASSPLAAPYGTSRAGSIGWVRPDFDARVVDEFDREVPAGVVGELVIRGSEPWTMMAGYHGNAEATQEAWRNLWYHTGDAVLRTDDGEHVLVDRLRDCIRRRGENISSMEVEATIMALDDVMECAVVGVPSEHTDEEVLAVVRFASGSTMTPESLLLALSEELPYFMTPRYIRVVDELPRTPSDKVRKGPLREDGVTSDTWDREAAGIRITPSGVVRVTTEERA